MCGNIHVPSATFTAAVIIQVTDRPASGTSPRKDADPRILILHAVEHVEDRRRPDLAGDGRAEAHHQHDHQYVLHPRRKGGRPQAGHIDKASMMTAARTADMVGDTPVPSVRRRIRLSAVIWICT